MDAFRKLVRVRQGKRDGWLQFCAQIGVNPDALTTPFLENVDWATNVAEAISETLAKSDATDVADTEKIAKQELEVLLDAWADNP